MIKCLHQKRSYQINYIASILRNQENNSKLNPKHAKKKKKDNIRAEIEEIKTEEQ